ncbi:hypothetical protein [Dactylosporangium matsuzakiense]|uniref:Uncharacterized protein n=1 Tax=Dactylosporangium matsuzakiense TaxID=53360 RepID=A0A9W6KH63_9ACTN|nr:hypothetical protein [Dactylosporangium matsuzakiense]UWZ48634.1 hypothetical protein Dmats_20830 [Dactylosporangium matsuzakiense]GLL00660.1 hypothetical protein GCM10017581_024010 [Dactylosporangium matsuzakiense]
MFKRRPIVLPVWGSLAILALGWAVAGVALIAQRQAEAQQRRAEQAPVCAATEIFSGTSCRATVAGTMTALSLRQALVDVDGRPLTMTVSLHRIDSYVPGTPVQVTLYRGVPVRLDGDRIHIDAVDSPADRVADARETIPVAIYFGTLAGGVNLIVSLAVRLSKRQSAEHL